MGARIHFESAHTAIPSNNITGNGTINQVAKFTGANVIGDSIITDDGTFVGIGTTSPNNKLTVSGDGGGSAISYFNNTNSAGYGILINTPDTNNNRYALRVITGAGTALFVGNGGNVGIGTTSPTRTLHVLGQSGIGTVLKLEGAPLTTTYLQLSYNGATNAQSGYISYDPSSNMGLFTNDTERMRITPTGNVGIGTASPNGRLNIQSSASGTYLLNLDYDDGTDGGGFYQAASTDLTLFLKDASAATKVQIASTGNSYFNSGNVGIGTSTPTTKLMVEGTGSFGTVSNEVRLQNAGTFVSSTLNAHLIHSDGTGAYTSGNLLIQPRCSSGAGVTNIVFATSNNTNTPTERFRITADGVTFNGDTAAANALDDYEEGTWSPTDVSGAGLTFTTFDTKYTKIGNRVFFGGSITFPVTADTSQIVIGGLPYTASTGFDNTGGVFISATNTGRNDTFLILRNTTTFVPETNAGLSVINSSYSGKVIKFQGIYNVS
jgi:hypothetical protein